MVVTRLGTVSDIPGVLKLQEKNLFRNLSVLERLVGIYIWQSRAEKKIIDEKKLHKDIEDAVGTVSFEAVRSKLESQEQLPFIFEQIYTNTEQLENDNDIFLTRIKKASLHEELDSATAEMRKADAEGNDKKSEEAMNKCNDLHRKIAELNT